MKTQIKHQVVFGALPNLPSIAMKGVRIDMVCFGGSVADNLSCLRVHPFSLFDKRCEHAHEAGGGQRWR